MNIFLTGGTGYFGHELALELARRGYTVKLLTRDIDSHYIPKHPNVFPVQGDLMDKESLVEGTKACDSIFHAGAAVALYGKTRTEVYEVNVNGTINLLEAAVVNKIRRFVFTSSCATIGSTIKHALHEDSPRMTSFGDDYALSKFVAEQWIQKYAEKGLHAVIVNASKIFGPGINRGTISTNSQIERFLSGKLCLVPTPGTYQAGYVFIGDLIDGHLKAWEKGQTGNRYIINSANMSMDEIYNAFREVSGKKGTILRIPQWLGVAAGHLHYVTMRAIGKVPLYSGRDMNLIYTNKIYDTKKAQTELGFKPAPFMDTLKTTIDFLNEKRQTRLKRYHEPAMPIYPQAEKTEIPFNKLHT